MGRGQRLRGKSRISLRNWEECCPAENGGRKSHEMCKGLIIWPHESCVPGSKSLSAVIGVLTGAHQADWHHGTVTVVKRWSGWATWSHEQWRAGAEGRGGRDLAQGSRGGLEGHLAGGLHKCGDRFDTGGQGGGRTFSSGLGQLMGRAPSHSAEAQGPTEESTFS